MYFLYSIILTLGFLLMSPLFLLRREKYASGFNQRLGNYPEFKHDGRDVIWLHCVSVGETNAARPLVDALQSEFPDHRIVMSTTTRTGQELARKIFADKADAIIYFPFDFKFSVRRALDHFKPSLVLLMETEIWPRFIHEARGSGSGIAIVNGRLSERSLNRYLMVRSFVTQVLADVHMAIMQDKVDAQRMIDLGIDKAKVFVSGNLKFEQVGDEVEDVLTDELRDRFGITKDKPLIIAASTHEPEERYVIESLEGWLGNSCRLMIVPRHPQRFDGVEKILRESEYSFVRRSKPASTEDRHADIILLDTIGELRSAYPLAEIVFVGGSLVPHGGQSVIEPAAAGKPIVTGPHTHNFASVVKAFEEGEAILKIQDQTELKSALQMLLTLVDLRVSLGNNALVVMESNKDAGTRTVKLLRRITEG